MVSAQKYIKTTCSRSKSLLICFWSPHCKCICEKNIRYFAALPISSIFCELHEVSAENCTALAIHTHTLSKNSPVSDNVFQ